ncbi:MAG: hypothetical protein E4G98_03505, partial [Promethearchaeota archaeon]
MANRADDLIEIYSETKSNGSGPFSPAFSISEQETISNLTEDIRTRKNVIFYSPPHHARFFLTLESVLPIASECHKHVIIVLRDPKQIEDKFPQIRTNIHYVEDLNLDHPFLTLDLCHFNQNPTYRNHNESDISKSPIQKSTKYLPLSSMIGTFIRKFPFITKDMIPELALTMQLDPMDLLRAVSSVASVIVCTYEDVFAFHPLQPSIFKSLIDIEQSIVIYDDCHLLSDFVQCIFSFQLTTDNI